MKILVTGSKGQVGHCLVEQLNKRKDVMLLALDRDELDITNFAQVHEQVTSFAPSVIINAAAHTAVDKAEAEPELAFAINRDGPANLAKAAQRSGAAMLHISTDYVFDGQGEDAYREDDATGPQSVYGESKLAGEEAVAEHCPRHIILRTAWVFGEHGNNFVKTMLRLGKDRDALSIVGDQFGGPTYAGDIASVLIAIADSMVLEGNEGVKSSTLPNGVAQAVEPGVYHYSGLPHVSWFEFAKVIFDKSVEFHLLDKAPTLSSITTADFPTPAVRPANSKLDCAKIVSAFGVQASDWQSALKNIQGYE